MRVRPLTLRPLEAAAGAGHLVGLSTIENGYPLAPLEPRLQLIGSDPGLLEHPKQAMPSSAPDDQAEKQSGKQEAHSVNPEAHGELHHRIPQQVPDPGPCSRPDEGADHPVADEAGDTQSRRAGQAGRDRVQLGQESGGELERPRSSKKPVLSPTDERFGTGREPAEQRDYSRPAPPTYAVPAEVRAECGPDRDGEDLDNAQPAARRQRTRGEQDGNDRHRHAALNGKNPAEQNPLGMVQDHREIAPRWMSTSG